MIGGDEAIAKSGPATLVVLLVVLLPVVVVAAAETWTVMSTL